VRSAAERVKNGGDDGSGRRYTLGGRWWLGGWKVPGQRRSGRTRATHLVLSIGAEAVERRLVVGHDAQTAHTRPRARVWSVRARVPAPGAADAILKHVFI
jgi:hypothetical protein